MRGARYRDPGRPGRRRGDRAGRIACDSVLLAGGAWSRLFCGNSASICRSSKCWPRCCAPSRWRAVRRSRPGRPFGFRKRLDGGYTVATGGAHVDIVPDTFASSRLPAGVRLQWKKLRFRLGRRFFEEWRRRGAGRWTTPRRSRRSACSIPSRPRPEPGAVGLGAAFPVFRDMRVAESWGGMIDVTPDAVPVISAVDCLPGFFSPPAFPVTASASAPAPADWPPIWSPAIRRLSIPRRSGSPLHRRLESATASAGELSRSHRRQGVGVACTHHGFTCRIGLSPSPSSNSASWPEPHYNLPR